MDAHLTIAEVAYIFSVCRTKKNRSDQSIADWLNAEWVKANSEIFTKLSQAVTDALRNAGVDVVNDNPNVPNRLHFTDSRAYDVACSELGGVFLKWNIPADAGTILAGSESLDVIMEELVNCIRTARNQ